MLAKVRAFDVLILIKKTHAPASCMSLVSVIKTLGLVLMLVACAPPGPSLTCSTAKKAILTVRKIQVKAKHQKMLYMYMYMFSVHVHVHNMSYIYLVLNLLIK